MPSLSGMFGSSSSRRGHNNAQRAKQQPKPAIADKVVRPAADARQEGARHRVYDVTYGPAPPRGSVTTEKLFYLDWRLAHIRDSRLSSERTQHSWEDGRNTIGRTSFEEASRPQADAQCSSSPTHTLEAPVAVPANVASGDIVAAKVVAYTEEKRAGSAALKQALMVDNAFVSVPLLARMASQSDSEDATSDDSHGAGNAEPANAAKPREAKPPQASLFRRAGHRISMLGNRSRPQVPADGGLDTRASLRIRALPNRLWQS
ncbi:hypothetical protein ACQY0O_003338 [Thecaphora frezii]